VIPYLSRRTSRIEGRLSGSKTLTRVNHAAFPLVFMDEPTQNIVAVDLRHGHGLRVQAGIGRVKVEAPMRSRPVVMLGVRAEDAKQMAHAEDENVVEALPSSTADRARPRRSPSARGWASSPP
jgi:hypothetical protein